MAGELTLLKYDKNGKLVETRGPYGNIIVTSGFSLLCRLVGKQTLGASQQPSFRWTGVGQNDDAESLGNTQLLSQLDRNLNKWTHGSSKSYTALASFSGGEFTGNVKESGLFNAAAAGVMLNRKTFTAIAVGAADKLTVQWKISFTQG